MLLHMLVMCLYLPQRGVMFLLVHAGGPFRTHDDDVLVPLSACVLHEGHVAESPALRLETSTLVCMNVFVYVSLHCKLRCRMSIMNIDNCKRVGCIVLKR